MFGFCPANLLTSGLFFGFFFFFPSPGQLYGLEKFWAFLKYSKAKNLDINSKLQEYLSKFKRLEDFRVDVSRHNSCTTLLAPKQPSEDGGFWGSPGGGRRRAVTPTVTASHCSQTRNKLWGWNIANPLCVG